jgi:hypothetical protein
LGKYRRGKRNGRKEVGKIERGGELGSGKWSQQLAPTAGQ